MFYANLGEVQLRRNHPVEAEQALWAALHLAESRRASLKEDAERMGWTQGAAPVYLALAEAGEKGKAVKLSGKIACAKCDQDVAKVTNATDQTQQTSVVAYADGYKTAAQVVATTVGINSSEVLPMDTDTRVQAGDTARVVIVVGADTATKAQ
jgi:hypothetical protein